MRRFLIAFLQLMVVAAFIRWSVYVFAVDTSAGGFFTENSLGIAFGISFFALIFALSFLGSLYPTNLAKYWKDGKVGVGEVQTYEHRGLKNGVRNYRIAMQVEGEDGAVFDGILSVPVGKRRLPALHQGQILPVVYRAKKPKQLYVPHGPLKERAQLFYDFYCLRTGRVDQLTLNAGYYGLPGRAVIAQEMSDGLVFPGKERLHLDLSVFTPDGHQFPSTATVLVDAYQKDVLHQARYLEVKYLPEALEKVAVRIPKAPKVG
ncbi:hypothetical protein CKALI_09685 [Corynebacterium kalinowskii]|uniref:DUF3592 domain-containing protein n=1 Tax=Corynebacterium kalinowskii TaxID=2675216 RepID=A0A6B8VCC8_9CORY|nr:hypothetical protein [Corynebacterium kalinowskii]QGU02792.1 hypothetical protein CKALI_09685 [Corynebacterium kalinowskii]